MCWLRMPPLGEQRAIAAVLDAVDDAIRKTEQIIAKLQQVKQGLLHDLLTRGIDDNGELRDPKRHPEQFQDSPLGRIPKGWVVKTVGSVGNVVTGRTPPAADPNAWGDSLPFVTPADIADGNVVEPTERGLSQRGCRYVPVLPARAVLVVCIASLGKSAFMPTSCATNQQINAVICDEEVVDPVFLHAAIDFEIAQLHRWAGLQAVPIVNKAQFSKMLVSVPPLAEQKRIAERVLQLELQLSSERTLAEHLRLTSAGLAEDLLTGRVRTTSLPEVRP